MTPYPELSRLATLLLDNLTAKPVAQRSGLTVTVYSFSFKKGIPVDDSGNGGGYVFDCRGTNNPGRYDEYKSLTGLDRPVIDFLEKDGEILTFLESVYNLVDHHVARFIERDFTNLQVSFGCTGGQHRSVYCAEHLAQHLHTKYNVRIHLIHREQGINRTINSIVNQS
jgi:RNase adaptor protein for sRNA GlmZ degradation